MLRILATYDIHISSLLPAHALAPIAQLLDRAAHLHAARLLSDRQASEARCQVLNASVRRFLEARAQERSAAACWCVDVVRVEGADAQWSDSWAREECPAEREEEGTCEHFGGLAGCRG